MHGALSLCTNQFRELKYTWIQFPKQQIFITQLWSSFLWFQKNINIDPNCQFSIGDQSSISKRVKIDLTCKAILIAKGIVMSQYKSLCDTNI